MCFKMTVVLDTNTHKHARAHIHTHWCVWETMYILWDLKEKRNLYHEHVQKCMRKRCCWNKYLHVCILLPTQMYLQYNKLYLSTRAISDSACTNNIEHIQICLQIWTNMFLLSLSHAHTHAHSQQLQLENLGHLRLVRCHGHNNWSSKWHVH